jgi:hypothetical protein
VNIHCDLFSSSSLGGELVVWRLAVVKQFSRQFYRLRGSKKCQGKRGKSAQIPQDQKAALDLCIIVFSRREPASASLALGLADSGQNLPNS